VKAKRKKSEKYKFKWEEGEVRIYEGRYWVAEFYPHLSGEDWDTWEESGYDKKKIPKFRKGTLEIFAIPFPRHFVEDSFEKGDGLDKLEKVLKDYLKDVERWKDFCKKNPKVKVKSDGYCDFKASVEIKVETSDLEGVKRAVIPWLEVMPT
jgi:hypothetical protein